MKINGESDRIITFYKEVIKTYHKRGFLWWKKEEPGLIDGFRLKINPDTNIATLKSSDETNYFESMSIFQDLFDVIYEYDLTNSDDISKLKDTIHRIFGEDSKAYNYVLLYTISKSKPII